MVVILVLAVLAFAIGTIAFTMASTDFENGSTFRRHTGMLIYLAWTTHAAAFMAALWLDPYRLEDYALPALVVGISLAVVGGVLFTLGLSRFQSLAQVTGTEVGGLVTSGAYRYSRNPQYMGWILLLLGVGVVGRSPLAVLLALAVLAVMWIWIPHEEKHLVDEFGDHYRRYAERVPRFIGLKRGRPPAD